MKMTAPSGRAMTLIPAERWMHRHRQQRAGGTTICTWVFSLGKAICRGLGVDAFASSSWTPTGFLVDSGFVFPAGLPPVVFLWSWRW